MWGKFSLHPTPKKNRGHYTPPVPQYAGKINYLLWNWGVTWILIPNQTRKKWLIFFNELKRLAQGVGNRVKGNDIIFILAHDKIPKLDDFTRFVYQDSYDSIWSTPRQFPIDCDFIQLDEFTQFISGSTKPSPANFHTTVRSSSHYTISETTSKKNSPPKLSHTIIFLSVDYP